MKKILPRLLIGLVLLAVVAVGLITYFMDRIVKSGIETVGPEVAKVSIRLDKASLSLMSGNLNLGGLVIGNPAGYATESAIKAAEIKVVVEPSSVLSDKVVVKSVVIAAPEITIEGSLKENNLTKILDNINASLGGGETKPAGDAPPSKETRIQVNDLQITDGKINIKMAVLGGKSATVPLPTIHLTDLGTDANGITGADLSKRVMAAVLDGTIKASTKVVLDLGKQVINEATGSAAKAVTEEAKKAVKGIGDLFKKSK